MYFVYYILRRYLSSGRRSSFIRFLTTFTRLGIVMGVAVLLVTLSMINGYQQKISEFILAYQPHLRLTYQLPEPFVPGAQLPAALGSQAAIVGVRQVVTAKVLIQQGNLVVGASLVGMDPLELEKLAQRLPGLSERYQTGTLLVGGDLALRVGVEPGGSLHIITDLAKGVGLGQQVRSTRGTVSAIFTSGMFELDNSRVFTDLQTARRILKMEQNQVSELWLELADPYQAEAVSGRLQEQFRYPYWFSSWISSNHNLFTALYHQKLILSLIMLFLILVAAFNIISSLIMLVMEKRREVGVLMAIGAQRWMIRAIFIAEGFLIGVWGTAVGVLLGWLVTVVENRFHIIKLPSNIYNMGYLALSNNRSEVLAVVGFTIVISLLATALPAWKAPQIDIVGVIKDQ